MNDRLGEQPHHDDGERLAVLPLRNVVVYPHMVIPLFVGRKQSMLALEAADQREDKRILLVAQKDEAIDEPDVGDLHAVGTVATLLQMLKLPDGTIKVLVEGQQRAEVEALEQHEDAYLTAVSRFPDMPGLTAEQLSEQDALIKSVSSLFDQYVKSNKKVPPEVLSSINGVDEPDRVADMIAAQLTLEVAEKQKLLEIFDPHERLEQLLVQMESALDMLQVDKRIRGRVKQQMEKSQREYYLNEQMKAIQKELGEMEDAPNEVEALQKRIESRGLSKEARKKAMAELNKLKQMSPMSAEATVVRNYIDTLVSLPWKKKSRLDKTLADAEEILELEHYGLEKVKERIIEYLAVQARVKRAKGPILCLVGPPGVGKTSLGKSIARATGRRFSRIALGGVRDEAEIRGHRRTYIGSMPGKIVQNLAKVKRRNPLILLDEIDKMSMDFRGDPSSALLEVLDPEQNHTFTDHYLEVEFDLSDVMFVATANTMNIPEPLLDRMEVIRIPGYTEMEKQAIAERYLIPRKREDNGLEVDELNITSEAVTEMIRSYTREAGVRNLEREISKVCRKVVRELGVPSADIATSDVEIGGDGTTVNADAENLGQGEAVAMQPVRTITVDADQLEPYLGVPKFRYGRADEQDRIGQVTGLAWTQVGGELLTIESTVVPGKGKLSYTGKLGDVMQESIQAAMIVVRSRAKALGLAEDFHEKHDLHVHVPEGATPKDGPSAGIAMCTALVSALSGLAVKSSVAMTGEITLRGEVLPIGGLKEKLLAAQRGGIETVLIPHENRKDLSEVPDEIKAGLDIRPVRWIDEVLDVALAGSIGAGSTPPLAGQGGIERDDSSEIRHH